MSAVSVDPLNLTMSVTVVAGVASQALARRIRVPAIVPLLTLGILLGSAGIVRPEALGEGLRVVVGFAVAIVLFEGGLTLKTEAFRLAGRAIRNLVTWGVAVTWLAATAAAWLLFPEIGPGLALLYGALVIVTGPTVILPILHAVKPRKRVADVLRGEAILIDPIGALCAVLVLEYLISTDPGDNWFHVLGGVGIRVALGTGLGAAGAFLLDYLLRKQEGATGDLRNLTVLSGAIGLYSLSESLAPESGVLTVTLAGFLLGWLDPDGLSVIEEFKGHVTTLMVSIVFILLAANLDLGALWALGLRGGALVLAIVFVVRPLSVFLSTWTTDLVLREKLFLSWVAPRGIVAAAVSSLFALSLAENGRAEGGEQLVALVFLTIIGTVLLQGPTTGFVARMLGVLAENPSGFLIVGASRPAIALGRALNKASIPVILVDTNPQSVRRARDLGLRARRVNVLDEVAMEQVDTEEIGFQVAMTTSENTNRVATRDFAAEMGTGHARAIRLESALVHLDDPDTPGTAARAPAGPDPKVPPRNTPAWLFGERLSYEELDTRLRTGAELRLIDIDEKLAIAEVGTLLDGAVPLLALRKGRARFLADTDALQPGEKLLLLAPDAEG